MCCEVVYGGRVSWCVTIVVHIRMKDFREKTDSGWFVGIVFGEFHQKTKCTTFPGRFVRTVVVMTRRSRVHEK